MPVLMWFMLDTNEDYCISRGYVYRVVSEDIMTNFKKSHVMQNSL